MRRNLFLLATILTGSLLFSAPAHSSLNVYWSLIPDTYIANPTETVALTGTMFNDASSDKVFNGTYIDMMSISGLYGTGYSFHSWQGISSVVLNPGESADFIFGKVTPSSPLPNGSIIQGEVTLSMSGYRVDPERTDRIYMRNDYQITIDENSNPVPEPASLLLVGLGLVSGRLIKRKNKIGL